MRRHISVLVAGYFGGKVRGTFGESGRVSFYRQSCPKRSDPKLVRFQCQLIAYLKFGSLVFDDEVRFIILFFGCRQMSEYFVFSPLSLHTVILSAHSRLSDDSLYVFQPSSLSFASQHRQIKNSK
jgi:hypothetical protein